MNQSLIKLVDAALLPAALMVVSKFIGLVATIAIFKLPWTIQQVSTDLLSVRPAVFMEDLTTASTYSDLIMYLIMAIAFSVVIVQATHFHDTHIHPRLLVRLSNNNLLGLVKSSYDIYHSASMWLVFIWLTAGVVWIDIVLNKTLLWVGILTIIANIVFTSLLLQDVYREISISRRNLGKHQAF